MRKAWPFYLTALLLCTQCSDDTNKPMAKLHQLEGAWFCEETNQWEVWKSKSNTLMHGLGLRSQDGENLVLEYLRLQKHESELLYQATVLDQNDGATISFKLNLNIDSLYSFENPAHDFPQKIQYRFLDHDHLTIGVLNSKEEGRTFHFIRQAPDPEMQNLLAEAPKAIK